MLPKVITTPTTNDSILSQHYHQIQEVVTSVRGAVLEANGGIKSVSKLPTLPWKVNTNQSTRPDWLTQKPNLTWLSKEAQTQQTQSTPTLPSQSLPSNGTSSIGGNLDDTVKLEGTRSEISQAKSLPIDITKSEGGVQTDKSIDESGEKRSTSFAKGGNVYAGNLQKVIEMSQKRKKKESSVPFDKNTDPYGYSEAFLKMAEMVEKFPPDLKPEDFPGVRKIDDSPIEDFESK